MTLVGNDSLNRYQFTVWRRFYKALVFSLKSAKGGIGDLFGSD